MNGRYVVSVPIIDDEGNVLMFERRFETFEQAKHYASVNCGTITDEETGKAYMWLNLER